MFTWPRLHSAYVYLSALHSSTRFTHSSIDRFSSWGVRATQGSEARDEQAKFSRQFRP